MKTKKTIDRGASDLVLQIEVGFSMVTCCLILLIVAQWQLLQFLVVACRAQKGSLARVFQAAPQLLHNAA